jgi:DUF177 domain-containing protein
MSPAPADHVNAVELAGRAARLERHASLAQLVRVAEAGALEGTEVRADLEFGTFDGRVTMVVRVEGNVFLTCQRCLGPCVCRVNESAVLAIVERDTDEVPGGYEPLLGDPERLSVTEVIEEQVLLGLPLVPMHANPGDCGVAQAPPPEDRTAADERQRPFANLRQLLDKGTG